MTAQGWVAKSHEPRLAGLPGELGACALVLVVCAFLYSSRGVSLRR